MWLLNVVSTRCLGSSHLILVRVGHGNLVYSLAMNPPPPFGDFCTKAYTHIQHACKTYHPNPLNKKYFPTLQY